MLRKRIPYFFCLALWSLGISSSLLCTVKDVQEPTHETLRAWFANVLQCREDAAENRNMIKFKTRQEQYNLALSLQFFKNEKDFIAKLENNLPKDIQHFQLEETYNETLHCIKENIFTNATCIREGVKNGYIEKVRILLKAKPELINVLKEEPEGLPLLHAAVESTLMNDAQRAAMIQLLLEKGADQTLKDQSGQTALQLATEKGSTASLCALLEYDKNPEINADYLTQLKMKDGQTLPDVVAQRGSQKCIDLLKGKGVDIQLPKLDQPKVEPTGLQQPQPIAQPAQKQSASPLPSPSAQPKTITKVVVPTEPQPQPVAQPTQPSAQSPLPTNNPSVNTLQAQGPSVLPLPSPLAQPPTTTQPPLKTDAPAQPAQPSGQSSLPTNNPPVNTLKTDGPSAPPLPSPSAQPTTTTQPPLKTDAPAQPVQSSGQSSLPTNNPPVKQVTTASSQQEGSSASSTTSHKNWAIGALSAVVVLGIVGWLVKKSQHNSAQNENNHGEVELS